MAVQGSAKAKCIGILHILSAYLWSLGHGIHEIRLVLPNQQITNMMSVHESARSLRLVSVTN
jgi:hypothetical protein